AAPRSSGRGRRQAAGYAEAGHPGPAARAVARGELQAEEACGGPARPDREAEGGAGRDQAAQLQARRHLRPAARRVGRSLGWAVVARTEPESPGSGVAEMGGRPGADRGYDALQPEAGLGKGVVAAGTGGSGIPA